jgi:uncharacterized protein YndB with AHSA1/START domain
VTSVTIVRTIEAPPDAVFAAFVEPEKIALWRAIAGEIAPASLLPESHL